MKRSEQTHQDKIKATDDFNSFALNYKDYQGEPFYITNKNGAVFINPKCVSQVEQVMNAYKNYLKRK